MKTSRYSNLIVPLALLLTLTSACTAARKPLHEKTITLTVPHVPDSALRVQSVNGALSVKADDRDDTEIIARLRMLSAERLEATTIDASRDSVNRLTVQAAWPGNGARDNEGCSFTIAVPDVNGVELNTSNGRIGIAGLSGAADLESSNGGIKVNNHQGDVTARTSNGPITIREATGTIDIRSSNGPLDISGARQSVMARTSNGSIDIDCSDENTGPVDARSSNGAITLKVGAAFEGELEAQTSNGRVAVQGLTDVQTLLADRNCVRLRFGPSDNKSRLKSSNASIRILKR